MLNILNRFINQKPDFIISSKTGTEESISKVFTLLKLGHSIHAVIIDENTEGKKIISYLEGIIDDQTMSFKKNCSEYARKNGYTNKRYFFNGNVMSGKKVPGTWNYPEKTDAEKNPTDKFSCTIEFQKKKS